ncbi:MAG: hypothetical protein H0V47_07265 [Chloroflexia bacterium]|nr:hypothetical protein [Chloroflexia bacterium]
MFISTPIVRLTLAVALIVISSGIVYQPNAYAQEEQEEIERVGPGGPPVPGTGPVDTTSFVRVIDGNTVETWLAGSRAGIGLIGITAPMANTPCGQESASYLQNLVYGGLFFRRRSRTHL